MPKRKKFPRLPSGYGSIRYLGKGRVCPFAVHPPSQFVEGVYIRPKPLCYVPDWYTGLAVLTAYHAGTYQPGQELVIAQEVKVAGTDLDLFCRRVLKDVATAMPGIENDHALPTFADVYHLWFDWKYGEHAAKKLSEASKRSTAAAFKLVSGLHNRPFSDITLPELQDTVNALNMSSSSVSNALSLIKQMYRFAIPRELCQKDFGNYVVMPSTPDQKHHEAFTDEELEILWRNTDAPLIRSVLIMCYSGFRISAFETMETNLNELYFRGGVKTAAGKDRIVPIHSGIVDFVVAAHGDYYCGMSSQQFREKTVALFPTLGIRPLTPHSCRHTFSRLCESFGVSEADRKRMMGHSFGSDITNGIYGHRTIGELRQEIEKIKIPAFVTICD